jgi:CRP-like cAMP-binding protein
MEEEMSSNLEKVRQSISKLADIPAEEWGFYRGLFEEVRFKRKAFVTPLGEIEKYAYFILEGAVRYVKPIDDKEICVDLGFKGNFVSSFASCLAQTPSQVAIQAVTPVVAMRLNYEPVRDYIRGSSHEEHFHRRIAEQLYIRETKRTYSLISQTAEERYLNLIKNQPDVLTLISIKDLASYLGVHPDSLSRIRNKLA